MKNRILQVLIGLFVFFAVPFTVDASSASLVFTCNDVVVNKTTTCTVQIKVTSGNVSAVQFNVATSGVSIENFTNKTFSGGMNGNVVSLYGNDIGSSTTVGTFTLKGVTVGKATISASNVTFTEGKPNYADFDGSNAAASFTVKAATTTTTTKKTTTTTTTKKTTTTTRKASTTKSTTKKTTTTTKKGGTTTTTKKGGSSSGGTTTTTRKGGSSSGGTSSTYPGGTLPGGQTTTTRNTVGPITNPTTSGRVTQGPITNDQGEIIYTTGVEHPTTTQTDEHGNPITVPGGSNPGGTGPAVTYPTSIRYVTNNAGEVIWSEIINRTDPYYTEKRERPTRTYEDQYPGLKLVRVDDYHVVYKDGKYYATTDPLDDEVIISAIPDDGVIVIGTGTRGISVGKNVVDLILKDGNDTITVQVVITRPDGLNVKDTRLTSLKVVDYRLDFDPSTTEYTVTVPYTTKELYVIAKHMSDDVTIGGDGLHTIIDNENNTIYIQASYGSMETTEYVIHVKKSYTTLILWIVIGLLGGGLVAMAIYAYMNKKEAVSKVVAEKDKVIAEGNRTVNTEIAKDAVIGGDRLAGLTRKTVKPIPVNPTPEVAPVQAQPVNPEPVQKVPVQMSGAAPQPQVKVIRRVTEPQAQQTSTGAYQEDNIVIKEL